MSHPKLEDGGDQAKEEMRSEAETPPGAEGESWEGERLELEELKEEVSSMTRRNMESAGRVMEELARTLLNKSRESMRPEEEKEEIAADEKAEARQRTEAEEKVKQYLELLSHLIKINEVLLTDPSRSTHNTYLLFKFAELSDSLRRSEGVLSRELVKEMHGLAKTLRKSELPSEDAREKAALLATATRELLRRPASLKAFLLKSLGRNSPWERGPEWSRCYMYDRNYSALTPWGENASLLLTESNLSLVPCRHGWDFDYSVYATTVVTEWEMVCEKDFYTTLALVLLGLGGLVGNYIFGYLQDSLGRRPSFFIYLFIECLFGIATAFAQDFTTWVIFRVGVGFTVPAILGTPYVLAIELVGPSHRTMVTILTNIAYSLGLMALAVVAYLVRDWRQLALATSVPFLTFFLYWWVLPESPRWLLARGRFDEAEKILNNMARVNGRCLNPNHILDMKRKFQVERMSREKSGVEERSYGVLDLFSTPNLRRKTIIITFIWFTNTSVYVGLSYYAATLSGDEFLNFLLAGAVELPTYLVLWPSMEKVGRRWTLCVSMLIGGVACLATVLSQHDDTTTLVLYCIGKMGISSSYVVLPLMASELYPTVVRGLGMSTSSVAGMLGPVFIPIVNYWGEEMLVLPLLIMGGLLVAGGGCSLLLPETLHQHLPQTLEDGENFGKEWCNFCPTKIGMESDKIPTNMPESPIKSLLQVSLKETPASTPLATDITSSTDVNSDTVFAPQEQTLRVTVV